MISEIPYAYESMGKRIHHCRRLGSPQFASLWWEGRGKGRGQPRPQDRQTDVWGAWSVPPAGQPADVGAEVQESVDHDGVGHGALDAGPVFSVALEKAADQLPQPLAVARVYRLQGGRRLHYLQHQGREILCDNVITSYFIIITSSH